MDGLIGFLAVFFFMCVSGLTAHHWFDVPPMVAGGISCGMWPVVERQEWGLGALWYIMMVVVFSGW
jgi:hypothetical protein